MAKQIEVPGQGIVEFPDSMSDEQIADVLKKQVPAQPQSSNPRMDKIKAFAAETDRMLGLTPGLSERQLFQESRFRNDATSPVGAMGIAQVMPATLSGIEKKVGRKLNPRNEDDALLIHREVMRENIQKFGNEDDALRAYNAGWDKTRWNNPETNDYIAKIKGGQVNKEGYVPFAQVRKNIDIKSLDTDPDWINAALVLHELWAKKPFEGTPKEAAQWGKDFGWWFDNNIPNMAMKARDVIVNGTDEEKAAMLYMMDTMDNTKVSWEGFGRSAIAQAADPSNYLGIATLVPSLGASMATKQGVKVAEKQAIKFALKQSLKQSLARTGIAAGIDTAIMAGTQDAIKQNIEVSAGRREEVDLSKVGLTAAIGGVAGVALGTAGDMAITAATPAAKRAYESIRGLFGKNADVAAEDVGKVVSGITPQAPSPAEAPALYRGQPKEFSTLQKVENSDAVDNILIGRGIFTTTDKEMASTYGENLFKFEIPKPERVLDISNAPEDALKKVMPEQFFREEVLYPGQSYEQRRSVFETYKSLVKNGKTKEAEDLLIESLAEKYLPEGVTWSQVKSGNGLPEGLTPDSIRDKISADVQAAGFDFIKHKGGIRQGGGDKTHDVYIALKDEALIETSAGKVEAVGTRGSSLTPEEIAAATARKQDGRLPADEIVPNAPTNVRIDIPEINTGLRTTRVNGEDVAKMGKAELDELANKVVEQIRPLKGDDLIGALEQLRSGRFSVEEGRVVARSLKIYADEIRVDLAEAIKARDDLLKATTPDPERLAGLEAKIADLETSLSHPSLADDAFGSMAGSILQDRQKGLTGVNGITPETIMAERGVTKEEAQQIWADLVGKAAADAEIQKVASSYDAKAAAALESGDDVLAARITAQKWKELDARVENIAPGSASFVQKLTELAISNVFSLKTVIVNLIPSGVKTLVIPGLKFIQNNPFEKAARAELMASYSAMRSTFNGALKAAWAGYKYEQALLTRDGMKLVEGELALKGRLGGALRIFPRILNATDEFLSRINYDSFIAGRAAADAAMEGSEKGLKGKELDKFIKAASEAAMANSRSAEKGDELVMPIINKGINLGLSGEDLWKFVEKEAVKNPEALKKGTDQEALDFVRDVLYKREFSGDGFASKAAKWYEDGTRKFPSIKLLVGQLFFRTPIRVFEEGIRLTPGLQFIAPNFMADLAGTNGAMRQIRARSEAMVSLGVAGAVLSLYAQGRITGDGAYDDYKQTKNRLDSAKPEPYTIKFADGSTWNFKGFDPIATPMKIMVNALERIDQLRLREAQGEFISAEAYKMPIAAITVATGSVAQAIRDASLVEGLNNTIKFAESFADPEQSEDKFIKALGDKLFLLVPNTLHKIAKDNDPTINDPKTFWQMVEEKLLRPFGQEVPGVKTSKAYDLLGNPRRMSDTGSLWNVFSTSSVEERNKGLSEDQQFVLGELDRLSKVTGVTFNVRTKHESLGDLDLRTVMASDGKQTLWDKWQENYRSLNPEAILKPILAAPIPEGTYKYHEGKTAIVQQQITQLQNAAFDILMSQESKLIDRMVEIELTKARSKAGMFDTPRP